ncbi:pleiotropic drug resistance ABC transporter [Irpex rosettiformis]|uniref:Pleiotropic drug resistance ABC transporter n=1 Tax=Irpex rosettiformis TaxID=378272 RepID=A0ACB8U587_9APHY|nr:pleiotropic drug resistance ABC transporter [Irpex rosettiformis]
MSIPQSHKQEPIPEKPSRSEAFRDRRSFSSPDIELTADDISDDTLDGLANEAPFDLERFLRRFMKQRDKAENVVHRELGVYFKDLHVTGLGASVSHQPTVGSMIDPRNIIHAINDVRHPAVRSILTGFEGVVRPGEMLLVLGRPGAGCSSFLKTLANHTSEFHGISGEVRFSSLTPDAIEKHYRGDVQYCPEDDVHFPTLTVEETLRFASKTRAPKNRLEGRSRKEFEKTVVDLLMSVFGLRAQRDTKVGDAWVRGVSGGEKKRVSLAEVMATRCLLGAWDGATTGLDSSTALEFIQSLRIATDAVRMTTIVSIYQAGESLYELFDKVCVIYEGKMVYFGPANKARQYFIDLGYEPANRQTTADFLVAVTDPNGRIPRAVSHPVPRTSTEFAEHFKKHPLAQQNKEDMALYHSEYVESSTKESEYRRSAMMEHAKHARKGSPYVVSLPMQARALMVRRWQILMGRWETVVLDMTVFLIQAIIMGTVFFRLKNNTSTFFSRGGVLFFAILFSALTTMAEIPALFSQRPIVLRQFRAAMYHPFAESAALTLVDVPMTLAQLTVFCILLYFFVGLQESAGQFFIFYLFVFAMTITMKAWFRALTAAFHQPAPAQTVAGMSILLLTLYTGYTIPQPSMIGALRWITYINPLKYGFEAIMMNEMHTIHAECSTLIPQGPGYDGIVSIDNQVCTSVGSQPGQSTVSGELYAHLSFGYAYSHLWRNFGIVCVFGIAFVSAYWILTELNTRSVHSASVTWFKRGSKATKAFRQQEKSSSDPEKGEDNTTTSSVNGSAPQGNANGHPKDTNMRVDSTTAPAMTDIFSWQHLEYTVPLSDGSHRKLLDDVSGFVAPGKLTALMGESGAGKTTLLNVLAERTNFGVVKGDRFVNGHAPPQDFGAQTGYCQQQDTHLATQTVREALIFSAMLRQPPSVPLKEKEDYAEKCLEMCGLEAYADAIVGTLNVEMRKRTTIAVELVAKPRLLLFLDEPTSGLDSQSAWAIVAFLRELADKAGQAILCTIHQPSGELFQVFDRLLLLKVGGQTVYYGDLGYNSSTIIEYFQRNGARECKTEENPAEYILQVIGAGANATADRDWHEIWKAAPESVALQEEIDRIHAEGRQRPPVEAALDKKYATLWPYQVATLTRRGMQSLWRSPTYIISKIALNVVAGLFIGFTFFKSKDSIQGTQNKLFSIFMGCVISVAVAQQLQVPFITMRDLYEIRERPSRMYSWTALLTSQILGEIPWNIFGSSLFFLCWFWTVGYESTARRAGYMYLVQGVLFPLYYTTVGQAIASMAPNTQIAALLFSFTFSFVLIFNGVLQPFSHLGWWQWMYHVSPYTYLIEGLLSSAVGNQDINCASVEFVRLTPPAGQTCSSYLQPFVNAAGGYILNGNATDECAYCPFRTTNEFLSNNFNMKYSHRWRDVGIFVGFIWINIGFIFVLSYIFRFREGSVIASIKRRIERFKNRKSLSSSSS